MNPGTRTRLSDPARLAEAVGSPCPGSRLQGSLHCQALKPLQTHHSPVLGEVRWYRLLAGLWLARGKEDTVLHPEELTPKGVEVETDMETHCRKPIALTLAPGHRNVHPETRPQA